MDFKKLLVVIPTRNRSTLTINAIESTVGQADCEKQILVSDNSTDLDEISALSTYCTNLSKGAVELIRPPKPLPMTHHWDWAMDHALKISGISHIAFMPDRCVLVDRALRDLTNILSRHPSEVVSFSVDSINDLSTPVTLTQIGWTGKLFEVETVQTCRQYARTEHFHSMPRMINCAVPVSVLSEIKRKYGTYFSSVAPDYNFLTRILRLVPTYLYYDKPLYVSYGLDRSSGNNTLKGNFQKDSTDFTDNLSSTKVNFPTPVDDIRIMPNAIMFEYYAAKALDTSGKFPEMNRSVYLRSLVFYISRYENLSLKSRMAENVKSEIGTFRFYLFWLQANIKRKLRGINIRLHNLTNSSDPYIRITNFENIEQAIKFAIETPRAPSLKLGFLAERTGVKKPTEIVSSK